MTNYVLALGMAGCAMTFANIAMASDVTPGADQKLSIEQASQYLHYSGGNDRFRVELAPNYSEELGFSMKGAAGGYLTDAIALGLIVEYGENKREYLANAGIQFNEALSFVGTIGLLEEHNEYVDGEDREKVQQMEYGASFKGAYEIGFLSGFELNGYLADTEADSDSVEAGKLYGVQLLADLDLTSTTHIEIGGGYEWLEWDDTNDDDGRWSFSAEAVQKLGDVVSLTGHTKLGASEFVYGGGIAFDLSNGGVNTNLLGVSASYIDGRNGIEDDRRIELSWAFGFGAGPAISVASDDLMDNSGTIRAAADVATMFPANNLLGDVMKRPSYLPERVIARSQVDSSLDCTAATATENPNVVFGNAYDETYSPGPGRDFFDLFLDPDLFVAAAWSFYVNGSSSPLPTAPFSSNFDNHVIIWSNDVFAPGQDVVAVGIVDGMCYKVTATVTGPPP
jgi:hypothetical protein